MIIDISKTIDLFQFYLFFPKLLERIVYNRIINYVDKFDISDHQYGLRKNHSTSQALLQLYNKISAAIDRKEFTVGIFLDLSKALDTVNHDILFDNLEHYGIRGVALDWMKNYFHNRLQFVQYNDTLSTFKSIRCGVPQRSILGPLLFLLYINDLCDVTNVLEFILFADDTNLFYSHKNQSSLANVINREIHKLSEWFRANKLSINIKKSNYMLFKPRQKRLNIELPISLNGDKIDMVKEVVFLGVILDEHISWKPHISHVARKISKSIGIIYKASFCLSKTSLYKLYYSLVYPYIQYCIIVWGSTYQTNLNRIVLLQLL